jgi:hypothetical protein
MNASKIARLALILLLLSACKRERPPSIGDAATFTRAAPDQPPNPRDDAVRDPNVRPVYPLEVKPSTVAQKLCDALHAIPVTRRAECCKASPGVVLTSECVRNLSAALAQRAVVIDAKDIDACRADMEKAYEGCDWIGPYNRPPPKACLDILHGQLGVSSACRSSLECADGLRCLGVGPTDVGRCGPPSVEGRLCNSAVDPLAVYTRQDDYELHHPACDHGWCDRNRCEAIGREGAECKSNPECGPEARCKDGKCAKGAVAKKGEPCLGGDCTGELRCVQGKCAEPKPLGATCTADPECNAACISGKCQTSCNPAPQLPPGALKRLNVMKKKGLQLR